MNGYPRFGWVDILRFQHEDHRKKNKEILTRHFYDMSNMMSRNEGVWLSNGWVKIFLWIFLPCFLYTVISIVYFVASYIDK